MSDFLEQWESIEQLVAQNKYKLAIVSLEKLLKSQEQLIEKYSIKVKQIDKAIIFCHSLMKNRDLKLK